MCPSTCLRVHPPARHGKPGTGRYQRSSGGYGRYVMFGLIGLVVIGALCYGPVTRSMAMGKLDAGQCDGRTPEGLEACH